MYMLGLGLGFLKGEWLVSFWSFTLMLGSCARWLLVSSPGGLPWWMAIVGDGPSESSPKKIDGMC